MALSASPALLRELMQVGQFLAQPTDRRWRGRPGRRLSAEPGRRALEQLVWGRLGTNHLVPSLCWLPSKQGSELPGLGSSGSQGLRQARGNPTPLRSVFPVTPFGD